MGVERQAEAPRAVAERQHLSVAPLSLKMQECMQSTLYSQFAFIE